MPKYGLDGSYFYRNKSLFVYVPEFRKYFSIQKGLHFIGYIDGNWMTSIRMTFIILYFMQIK